MAPAEFRVIDGVSFSSDKGPYTAPSKIGPPKGYLGGQFFIMLFGRRLVPELPANFERVAQVFQLSTREIDAVRLQAGCVGYTSMALIPADVFIKIMEKKWIEMGKKNTREGFEAARDAALVPENLPGIQGPWLKFEDAKQLKGVKPPPGPDDKVVFFAKQGYWKGKDGKTDTAPRPDSNGMVPKDSILFTLDVTNKYHGKFNYVVYHPSGKVWVDANHGVSADPEDPQKWFVRKEPQVPFVTSKGEKLNAIVYYAMIIRGKK
jgi:hypothetical protein